MFQLYHWVVNADARSCSNKMSAVIDNTNQLALLTPDFIPSKIAFWRCSGRASFVSQPTRTFTPTSSSGRQDLSQHVHLQVIVGKPGPIPTSKDSHTHTISETQGSASSNEHIHTHIIVGTPGPANKDTHPHIIVGTSEPTMSRRRPSSTGLQGRRR